MESPQRLCTGSCPPDPLLAGADHGKGEEAFVFPFPRSPRSTAWDVSSSKTLSSFLFLRMSSQHGLVLPGSNWRHLRKYERPKASQELSNLASECWHCRQIIAVSLLRWNCFQYCSGNWRLLVMRQVVVQWVRVAGPKSSCLRLGVCTICWRIGGCPQVIIHTYVCACTRCSNTHKNWLHFIYSSRTRALGEWQSGTSSPLKHNHKLGTRTESSWTWASANDTLGANSSSPTFQLNHHFVKRQYCLSRDCTIMAIPCALATQ